MVTRVGLTKGVRVLVKLPFASDKTAGGKPAGQHVRVKSEVAKLLGFKIEQTKIKKVKTTVNGKQIQVERAISTGTYRQRSVKLLFARPQTIDGKKSKSVSLPLCSGATIVDVIKYFESGQGKTQGVAGIVTPHAQKKMWAEVSAK